MAKIVPMPAVHHRRKTIVETACRAARALLRYGLTAALIRPSPVGHAERVDDTSNDPNALRFLALGCHDIE